MFEERTMASVVALVHGSPGAYGISFPDFPGCISGGATIDEALRRGRDALDFHVESMIEVGEPSPKVRSLDEIEPEADRGDDFVEAVALALDIDG
jgi:predicted RNase H-like HicB family nuclease